ncbi:MAG: EF-hand domain-containing protein, partial [Desulfobulbus sp.]
MSVIGIGSSNNGYSIGQMMSRMQTRGPSKDEEKTDLSQLVTQLDTDTSGTLDTTDEIQSLADAINRASGVSSDLTEFLSTYDTDQSGTVSEDEALSALEANRPQGPPPPGGMGQPDESDMVNAADENGDGIIDEDEAASL